MAIREAEARHKVQHDLCFTQARNFGNYISIKEIKHQALKPVWYAFQDGIKTVLTMVLLPQAIVNSAIEHLLPIVQATFNAIGKPILDDGELEANRGAIATEYNRIVNNSFAGKQLVKQAFGNDLAIYNTYNLVNSPLTKGGFFATLEAQVIGVWTAFNTLTTDICTAVVDSNPNHLNKLGQKQITLENLLKAGDGTSFSWTPGELVKLFANLDSFPGTNIAYKQLFNNKGISAQ